MLIVPVRGSRVGLAGTAQPTVPSPVPVAPKVMVIQGALLVAVRVQPGGRAVKLTVPVPPPAGGVAGGVRIVMLVQVCASPGIPAARSRMRMPPSRLKKTSL